MVTCPELSESSQSQFQQSQAQSQAQAPKSLDPTCPDSWPIWLSVDQAAQVLSLPRLTVYQLCRDKRIKSKKFGRQIRINRKDLI